MSLLHLSFTFAPSPVQSHPLVLTLVLSFSLSFSHLSPILPSRWVSSLLQLCVTVVEQMLCLRLDKYVGLFQIFSSFWNMRHYMLQNISYVTNTCNWQPTHAKDKMGPWWRWENNMVAIVIKYMFTESSFLFACEEHHIYHNYRARRTTGWLCSIQQKTACLVVPVDVPLKSILYV